MNENQLLHRSDTPAFCIFIVFLKLILNNGKQPFKQPRTGKPIKLNRAITLGWNLYVHASCILCGNAN